jgi:hypothetical protein
MLIENGQSIIFGIVIRDIKINQSDRLITERINLLTNKAGTIARAHENGGPKRPPGGSDSVSNRRSVG